MADDTQEDDASSEFAVGVITGEISATSTLDLFAAIETADTVDALLANVNTWEATQQVVMSPEAFTALQETINPLTDAVNDGIVPPAQAMNFWFYLAYNAGVTLIPAAGIYAFIQGYVLKWAQSNGWATYGPNPVATPLVQQVIESANAAQPLPGAATLPQALPSPSQGQQAVVQGTTGITPSTVTGGTPEGVSADQVSAALAVTAVDVLRVVAKVFDGMLPNMAPGQVPEALSQLNTAVNALEAQMQQVRNGQWPRGFVGLQEAVGGALQALNGLSQEVGTLAQQMATKADSGLEDAITAVKTEADATAGTVTGIVENSIPELGAALGTLTGTVGALDSQVTNQIAPELAQVTEATAANTKMLSGTDEDCLDQLCDDQANVTDPIKAGGATPSLLSKLGSLLGLGWTVGALLAFLEAMATMFQAPIALQGVVTDVEQLASWAESAAIAIEQELPLQ